MELESGRRGPEALEATPPGLSLAAFERRGPPLGAGTRRLYNDPAAGFAAYILQPSLPRGGLLLHAQLPPPRSPRRQNHEGRQWQRRGRRGPQLRAQGRQGGGRGGALPVRAERGHLPLRRRPRRAPARPAGRAAGQRAAVRHERLLLAPQGAGAHPAPEPQGEQGGDPPARHRLHLGPGVRTELGISSRDRRGPGAARSGSAQHPQRRDQRPGCRGGVCPGGRPHLVSLKRVLQTPPTPALQGREERVLSGPPERLPQRGRNKTDQRPLGACGSSPGLGD